jgi:hypothetical protein
MKDKLHFAILVALAAVFAGTALFAEVGPLVPSTAPAAALQPQPTSVPAIGGEVTGAVDRVARTIAPEWLVAILAFGLELAGRLLKTTKPWSLLYLVRDLCIALGALFNALGLQGDRVLQRTKEPGSAIPKV